MTLNFGGDGSGGDIVVLSGTAEVDESGPSAVENAAWAAKYGADWAPHGITFTQSFAQRFNVPLRIRITDVHGHVGRVGFAPLAPDYVSQAYVIGYQEGPAAATGWGRRGWASLSRAISRIRSTNS